MKPIDYAVAEIGNEEIPRGSNWGEHVEKYLKAVGINFPASWCMAFIYWCFEQWESESNIPNPLIRTGGVLYQWNNVGAEYKFPMPLIKTEVQPGDIFIMDFGHGLGHTGFVESVSEDGLTVETIEGNTNDTGSREGYEVCRRSRKVDKMKGFIRIPL